MPTITKSPQAREDLLDLANHIAENNLDAALRFLHAAETAFELLSRMPLLGGQCHFRSPDAAGLRVWAVRGFENYLIFYRVIEMGIDVVRVLHAARDVEAILTGRSPE